MQIIYPIEVDNNFKKYYCCYRVQQKLQIIHNNWGEKYRNGEITEAEWDQFRNEWYKPRLDCLVTEILRLRGLAKNRNWNININNFFQE